MTATQAPGATAPPREYDPRVTGEPVVISPPVPQTWSSPRRPARRRWPGGPLAGVALMIPALALPWFAIPLQAQRSAWSLPVVLAGLPSASWVSYGTVLAVCFVLACVVLIRHRGRPCAATAAIGAVVLIVVVVFPLATGTADWPLLQQLEDQTAQQTAIFGQFGYTVPVQQPSLMLPVPVTGTGVLLAGALRLGWLAAVAAGLVLLGSGVPAIVRARRAGSGNGNGNGQGDGDGNGHGNGHGNGNGHGTPAGPSVPLRWKLVPALGLLLAAGVLGRGALAGYLAGQGAADARAGNYQAARSALAVAARLNSRLASSMAYGLASGQVLLAAGGQQPLAIFADATARGAGGDVRGQVTELRKAVTRDPGNPLLTHQLDQASQFLGLTDKDLGALQALAKPSVSDVYTEGRLRYGAADYTGALVSFRRVLPMTGDANVISSAFTYIALSELKMGQVDQARLDLLRAVSLDTGYTNTLARSLVAGLYVGSKTGHA